MRTHHNTTQKHALYALPDHEVVEALLPRAVERHVAVEEAARLIRTHTGLVPLAIDPRGEGRVIWGDLGVHLPGMAIYLHHPAFGSAGKHWRRILNADRHSRP